MDWRAKAHEPDTDCDKSDKPSRVLALAGGARLSSVPRHVKDLGH